MPKVLLVAAAMLAVVGVPFAHGAPAPVFQEYLRPAELAPLPEGRASLYRAPWRAGPRTASAYEALAGIGLYYKHVPGEWTLEGHVAVMRQLAAAGVRRLRLAPHLAIYITQDWTAPKPEELAVLRKELGGCRAAGLRPCVVFVHIPPIGKPGTRELQEWWRQGDLMPAGEVGSGEFSAYLDKTYLALTFILKAAREAGFTQPGSYDLEMGQNLWWGAPAVPRPLPSTTLEDLLPGGRIYEFDKALLERLRQDGYAEPKVYWGETHHRFDRASDREMPDGAAGRAVSFYSAWTGWADQGFLNHTQYDKVRGAAAVWPVRDEPLRFAEGPAPPLFLARPESFAADRTRRENLVEMMRASRRPVAITSLGAVPQEIEDRDPSLDGWQLKSRALGRALAFWLNQGAEFVLLHSLYEGKTDEMTHALVPYQADPTKFEFRSSRPLATLRAFTEALGGAKKLGAVTDLAFQFALAGDPVLIPGTGGTLPLKASDAVALLPFQVTEKRFAVAAYVMTPNIARPMKPVRMTLRVDKAMAGGVATVHPSDQTRGEAKVEAQGPDAATVSFDLLDDVTFLVFDVR